MNFSFNVEQILNADADGFIIVNSSHRPFMKIEYAFYLTQVINSIGKLTSSYRSTKSFLIQADSFFNKENDILIIKAKNHIIYGFIRAGNRNIYFNSLQDTLEQLELLCIFDFYVHFSFQRKGIGKEIFSKLLQVYNNINPSYIAYDSPTNAMINFLRKHYSLTFPIRQHNHMVIYQDLLIEYERRKSNQQRVMLSHSKSGEYRNRLKECGQQIINGNYNRRKAASPPPLRVNTEGYDKSYDEDVMKWIGIDNRKKFEKYYLMTDNINAPVYVNGYDGYNDRRYWRGYKSEKKYDCMDEVNYYKRNMKMEKEFYKNRKENIQELEKYVNYNNRNYRYENDGRYYIKKNEFATIFDQIKN